MPACEPQTEQEEIICLGLKMEVERDIFREAFLGVQKSFGKLERTIAERCETIRALQEASESAAAELVAAQAEQVRMYCRLRSQRRLLWLYGAWASVATVAVVWVVGR